MPNTREKLIELLGESLRYSGEYCGEIGDCKKCRYDKEGNNCGYAVRADYFIANGVTVQQWIPVTERLPDKHGKPYVCWLTFPNGGAFAHILNWHEYGDNGYVNGQHFSDEGLDGMKVTHWMPLPHPPKGEQL